MTHTYAAYKDPRENKGPIQSEYEAFHRKHT